MVISKTIRNNKKFLKEPEVNTIPFDGDFMVRGKPAPLQSMIVNYTRKHPYCKMTDYYKLIPNSDQATVRKAIRVMITSNRIKQRFTVD